MHRSKPALAGLTAAIALLVAACGGAGTSSAPASQPPASQPPASTAAACADSTDPATVDVSIENSAFVPQDVTASAGDVVGWTNEDGLPHSAVITGTGCATDTLSQGGTGAIVFTAAGSYPYVCGIHSNMTGTITVQ